MLEPLPTSTYFIQNHNQAPWHLTQPKQVDIGPPFGHIDLAADAMEADLVIDLAKLKTHVMMRLTLGVKNMFGCVIGLEKSQWHLRAGIDRDLFAQLLVQICFAVNSGNGCFRYCGRPVSFRDKIPDYIDKTDTIL